MPPLPWTAAPSAPTGLDEYLVLGSRLALTGRRHGPRLLRAATKVRTQVLASPGAVGVSLLAQPFGGVYWTLSAWRDQASIDAFVRAEPHRSAMRDLRPVLRDAVFVTWTAPAGPPSWDDARARIAAARS